MANLANHIKKEATNHGIIIHHHIASPNHHYIHPHYLRVHEKIPILDNVLLIRRKRGDMEGSSNRYIHYRIL